MPVRCWSGCTSAVLERLCRCWCAARGGSGAAGRLIPLPHSCCLPHHAEGWREAVANVAANPRSATDTSPQ